LIAAAAAFVVAVGVDDTDAAPDIHLSAAALTVGAMGVAPHPAAASADPASDGKLISLTSTARLRASSAAIRFRCSSRSLHDATELCIFSSRLTSKYPPNDSIRFREFKTDYAECE
jgi:hypothetical protein